MEHLVQGFQAFSTSTVVPSQEEQLQSLGGPSHELGGCQDSKVEELRIQAAKATPSFQMPDKPAFKFTPSVGSWLQSKPPQAEDAKEAPTYWTLWRTEEGKFYFHNEDTDKTAWDLPPGGVVYLDEDALSMFLEQDLRPGTEEILAWRRGWGQWCSPPPSAVIRDSRTERSFSYETSLEVDEAPPAAPALVPADADADGEEMCLSIMSCLQMKLDEIRASFENQLKDLLNLEAPLDGPATKVKVEEPVEQAQRDYKDFLCDVREEEESWWWEFVCMIAA
ncbi:unnamed protein product [Effrenium voratum]|uniref:WW domain-containing protein n=1 Tax=Effrenium voratum TaxID=2562239 RepID=A0AA36I2P5_9DINO|nr:unnamed protein product [Effrenium voratum]